MHAALTLADRVGITVPLPAACPLYVAHPAHLRPRPLRQRHPADRRLRQGHRAAQGRKSSTSPSRLIRSLIDETRAEIILPLGGALIPYVVDPDDLAKATGAQVLNTKAIGIRFAEMCVAFGMTQSALTYPRAKLSYEDFVNK